MSITFIEFEGTYESSEFCWSSQIVSNASYGAGEGVWSGLTDLKQALELDGVDTLENPPGFRVRSHDPYGVLPAIFVPNEDGSRQLELLNRWTAAPLLE